MKKVVVIGGGTGTHTVLSGLKKFPVDLTAIVTVADSGGSTGRLRDEFGYLPPGDFRMALVALSEDFSEEQVLRKLFLYRFSQGEGLKGHNFGNLFLTALNDILGSERKALKYASQILRVKGEVLPVTTEDVQLVATYSDGSLLRGETYIDEPPEDHDCSQRITELWLEPESSCIPEVTRAILDADMIILGPGDLYTSILANIVVKGVSQAIQKSSGQLIYILNLMTKYGQTTNLSAEGHVDELIKYLEREPDLIFVDNSKYPDEVLKLYEEEYEFPVKDDLTDSYNVLRENFIADGVFSKSSSDKLKRSLIRHDSDKLAWELMKVLKPF
jgi:uncharacterized cofD-like protein